jgi:phytoene/squalene synthetase
VDLTELQSADAYCRHLASRHYENFSVLSLVLSSEQRKHLARIYAFCRTTDEYGDETNRLARGADNVREAALNRLELWRQQTEATFGPAALPIHPVLIALRDTIREFNLPAEPFLDLIQANVQDQMVGQYEAWPDLEAYCRLSAAPVGRMVLGVFRADSVEAKRLSDDVCIGLQLANHAQDVKRDAVRGRCYVPRVFMRDGGIPSGVRVLCDMADELLSSGERLESMMPRPIRIQLTLYRLGGQTVVASIRKIEYRTDLLRPSVSPGRKLAILARATAGGMARMEHAVSERSA